MPPSSPPIADAGSRQLLDRLSALFPLRTIDVPLRTRTITLTTARDIDALIDGISTDEFRVDERLPYWAELWHSAVALSMMLEDNAAGIAGRSVLELGCGLGLSGIVAAQLGARVTLSDFDPVALMAAELNARTNGVGDRLRTMHLDFRMPPSETWDLLIAADVIYERRFIDPLVDCIDACLATGGCMHLAEPNRSVAEPFFDRLGTRGFRDDVRSHTAFLHQRSVDISIHTITRR